MILLLRPTICLCVLTFAQSIRAGNPIFDYLDENSQSNIVFSVCENKHPVPCPLQYTNRLWNTNLFSLEEQKMLKAIPLKYKNVTTNVAPAGGVMTRLDKVTFAAVYSEGNPSDIEGIATHFAYTNSNAQEDVVFFSKSDKMVKYQSTPGNGYYVHLLDGDIAVYQELRDGVLNGLFVMMDNDRVEFWLRFTNGKATGNFYMWAPLNALSQTDGDGLSVQAKFKKPYDFLKYEQIRFDLLWFDKPKSTTNLWRKSAVKP